MLRSLAIASALCLVGCSLAELSQDGAPSNYTTVGSGTATTATDTGFTYTANSPEFYSFEGSLEVVNGDIDLALSALEVGYRNEAGEPLCSGIREVLTAVQAVPSDPDLPLYAWWDLELGVSPCGDHGQDSFSIGIGAWDPQLDAAASAQYLVGADLYSLYIQPNAVDTFVFGVSGTSEQFLGTTPPATAAPLPDGTYQLRTLYLLPVAGS